MKKIDLGQTIAVLANIGVLAGILFLAYEMRQNTVATRLASAESLSAAVSSTELTVAANPELADLVRRASEGDELTATEALRIDVFYRAAVRQWQNAYYRYLSDTLEDELWQPFREAIARTLAVDEGLRTHWRNSRGTYSPAFQEMIDRIYEERRLE